MAYYYPINFSTAIPQIHWDHPMDENSAENYVRMGYNVWTRYESDAASLAHRFPDAYRDVAHYRLTAEHAPAPTFNYSFEHYHTTHQRGHAHIMFGNAFEDASEHHMLLVESLNNDPFNIY